MVESSYKKNNYGKFFYDLIREEKPKRCVELGVLHGYSTVYIAKALRKNKDFDFFHAYDLWDEYKYNHGSYDDVKDLLERNNVKFVRLYMGDAFVVHSNYDDGTIDFLHVDISNDGEVVDKIMENWYSKISTDGIIIFEGGSKERDNVDWMIRYNKKSIRESMLENSIIRKNFIRILCGDFPSITVLIRR